MLIDTRPSTQKTSSACRRKVGTYLLPLIQTYIQRGHLVVEALYFFHVPWWCHLHYGPNLVWVNFDTSLRHHEPQELSGRHPECTLARIKLHVVRPESVEGLPEVVQMVVLPSTFYQHVIYVNLDVSSDLMHKHFIHEPLIRCACILKTERHHLIVEEALTGDERSFLLINFVQFDLIVTRKCVHEAQ